MSLLSREEEAIVREESLASGQQLSDTSQATTSGEFRFLLLINFFLNPHLTN